MRYQKLIQKFKKLSEIIHQRKMSFRSNAESNKQNSKCGVCAIGFATVSEYEYHIVNLCDFHRSQLPALRQRRRDMRGY